MDSGIFKDIIFNVEIGVKHILYRLLQIMNIQSMEKYIVHIYW